MCKTQKKKTFHFITLSQEQLKVQYIFEERHRSMKENCLWGRCKKKVKKTNNSAFSATHTYIKLTLVSFFLLFFMHLPLSHFQGGPVKKHLLGISDFVRWRASQHLSHGTHTATHYRTGCRGRLRQRLGPEIWAIFQGVLH